MYILIVVLLSGVTSQVLCQNISLRADKGCYKEGDQITLNVTYVGNDSVSTVEWNVKPAGLRQHYGSGLNIQVSGCTISGRYPDYFLTQDRVQYHCEYHSFTDSVQFFGTKRTHYEGSCVLEVDDLIQSEIQNAIWTVTLWSWNSLPIATKSIDVRACEDGISKTTPRTTDSVISSSTASTTARVTSGTTARSTSTSVSITTFSTKPTTASTSETVRNKPSPYVLSPTDMYNIIGK